MHLHPVLVVVVLAALAGCTESKPGLEADPTPAVPATTTQGDTSPAPSEDESSSTESQESEPEPEPRTVAQGLEVPWGIAFLPDGSALIAERDGATIQRLDPGGTITEVGTVPDVVATSEGGLLGLAVSPTYDADETIYAYVTTAESRKSALDA